MFYFFIAICLSIAIYLIFKYAGIKNVDLLSVVLVNYPICVLIGSFHLLAKSELSSFNNTVLSHSAVMGVLFISMFYLMGLLTKKQGVSVSSIVSRLSLVLPVVYFLIVDKESITNMAALGIGVAIVSMVLISNVSRTGVFSMSSFLLPIVVFIGYGLVDIGLKISQKAILDLNNAQHELTLGIFFFAGLYGWTFKFLKRRKVEFKTIPLGILLGIVNYYSIYFFILALEHTAIPSTVIFPLNGVLILVGATLLSAMVFKEKITFKKGIALSLAILSIILLSY